jgi:deoxyribose-phosphate aldolase
MAAARGEEALRCQLPRRARSDAPYLPGTAARVFDLMSAPFDPQSVPAVELARFIDHTLLKPAASAREVEKLCDEARAHRFYAVCVNPSRTELCRHFLDDTDVKVATVVGFPLGAVDADVKRYETEAAIDAGAHEIDVVLNLGRLKDGDWKYVLRELQDVIEAADERVVKVILETCCLTLEEKRTACEVAVEAGAHFVKTSTGFAAAGATVEDVRLMREMVGATIGVKASGGIRDTAAARAMLAAGANRLGTSSGVSIVAGV